MTAILIHSFADFNLYVPANAMVLSWISGISAGLPISKQDEKASVPGVPPRLLRGLMFTLGCLAILYSAAWLIYLHSFHHDAQTGRIFRKFGIYDSNEALNSLEREHGGETASVPPADLAEFLRDSPAVPFHWLVFGESLRRVGRTAEARKSIERALALGGRQPGTLFDASRFHFSLAERDEALKLMSRALAGGSPSQNQFFLREYDRWHVPPEQVLSDGLPDDRDIWRSYLRWQIQQDHLAAGITVWNALISRGYADNQSANEMVGFLLRHKQPATGAQAWADYQGARGNGYLKSNYIFNSDFESEPSGSPFDWSIDQTPGAMIDFDREIAHSGARSLRIQFDGKQNLSSLGIRQTVFLKPGRYRFQAYVRTKEISTDEGVVFQVASQQASNHLTFTTEPMLGSTDWKLVQHAFVMPAAGLIDVRLVRTPSLRFDSLIRGTLWIDQVSISPL